ncbi:MAG: hypothetical protein MMC23_005711 [Stictis urceolatum]|nr:hypothetical protein [Stictis urceolata]
MDRLNEILSSFTSLFKTSPISATLTTIGFLFLFSKAHSFIRLLFSLFILPGKPLSTFGPPSSWALITGASDGIGLEFATQLASKNFNVLLVSRTASKLQTLAQALESKYKIRTKTLALDFAHASSSDWRALAAQIADLDISILINNVGKSHSIPVPFAETPADELRDIVQINCVSTLNVTSLVLPGMRHRGRGLVLTMGSFGGLLPTPLLATYSGSKAFLQQWSSALGAEVAAEGITVQLVQSYLVTSAMSKVKRASATIPTPKVFVRSVLGSVGRHGGAQGFAYSMTPYWSHAIMQWGIGLVGLMGETVVGYNLGMHEGIRKRALRKIAREMKTE